MATLEKIRSKSVLLVVVIGVALLAFIVGDAITNSQNIFGNRTTVAKVGGKKIDITEYQAKMNELNNRLEQARRQNPQQVANFDNQTLSQLAIDQLIEEALIDDAVEKAGIEASSEQIKSYMFSPQNPEVMQLVQSMAQNGIAVQTPEQAYQIIFNPRQNGLTDDQVKGYQQYWVNVEANAKQLIKRNVYQQLLMGSVRANDLDKRALYNDVIDAQEVAIAYVPYGQLSEKDYPVTDADRKKVYEANKNQYKVKEPTKGVSFIAVSVSPSQADRNEATKLAQSVRASLSDSIGTLNKDEKKAGVALESKSLRGVDLPSNVKEFLTSAAVGEVQTVSENLSGFTIVKKGKTTSVVDSITLNTVTVVGENLPNKVLAKLNAGLSIDSVSARFAADSVMIQKDMALPLYTAQGPTNVVTPEMLDSLSATSGYITLQSVPGQGAVLAKLVKKSAPVALYEYQEATYQLNPSSKTYNDELAKLEKFLLENNTAAKFNENAAKAGYAVRQIDLTNSTPAVPQMMGSYYPDSRQVVAWVMKNGKPGEVGRVYENKDAQRPALYAVAVNTEFEDYVPMSQLTEQLTQEAQREKAGEKMVKQYSGKGTMEATAQAMGVQPTEVANFHISNRGAARDHEIVGRIAGTKAGNKVIVVKGKNGVYAYQVKKENKESFPYNDQQYEQQYFQMVNPDMDAMLRGSKEINNYLYEKFESAD